MEKRNGEKEWKTESSFTRNKIQISNHKTRKVIFKKVNVSYVGMSGGGNPRPPGFGPEINKN